MSDAPESTDDNGKVAKLASVMKMGIGMPMMTPQHGVAPWKRGDQGDPETKPTESDDVPVEDQVAPKMTHFTRAAPRRRNAPSKKNVAFESFSSEGALPSPESTKTTNSSSLMDTLSVNVENCVADPGGSQVSPKPKAVPPPLNFTNESPANTPMTTCVAADAASSQMPRKLPPGAVPTAFAPVLARVPSHTSPGATPAVTPAAASESAGKSRSPPPLPPPTSTPAPPNSPPPADATTISIGQLRRRSTGASSHSRRSSRPDINAQDSNTPAGAIAGAPAVVDVAMSDIDSYNSDSLRARPSTVSAEPIRHVRPSIQVDHAPKAIAPPPLPASASMKTGSGAVPPPMPPAARLPPPLSTSSPTAASASASTPLSQQTASPRNAPSSPTSIDDGAVLRTLHHQVSAAKAAKGQSEDTFSPISIHTFFPSDPVVLPKPNRTPDQVFLCGPLGYSSDPAKKGWRCMWAVLTREKLELYNKSSDSKPKHSVPLEACLVTASDDTASPSGHVIAIVRHKGDPVNLRTETLAVASAASIPVASIDTPVPDPAVAHKAWLHALRLRSENIEYIIRCRTAKVEADERVLRAFDAQVRTSSAHHVNTVYCPANMLKSLVSCPPGYVIPSPYSPATASGLTPEGIVLDLAGMPWSLEAATAISSIVSNPDSLSVMAMRFGPLPMPLPVVEVFLNAIVSNNQSGLVELDLSRSAWLSTPDAPQLVAKILACPHLRQLHTLTIRESDLGNDFISKMCVAVHEAKSSAQFGCVSTISVIDLSHNMIGDVGVQALTGVFQSSLSLSSCVSLISLTHNPVGDAGIAALCNWLKAPRPASGYGKSGQHSQAPYRAMAMSHLLLKGTLIGDQGAVTLCGALVWSTSMSTVDLVSCNKIGAEGAAALSHLAQINESLEFLRFLNYRLTTQGLNAMRLMYRFGVGDPQLFDEALVKGKKHYTHAVLASEYPED